MRGRRVPPATAPTVVSSIWNHAPNAVVQAAESVAFLVNGAGTGLDLVLATATDVRGLGGSNDAFYVQRSTANCTPDLEGGLPPIANGNSTFVPNGTPVAAADPVRNGFFIADLRFTSDPDFNGVGILKATAANLLDDTACPSGTQTSGSGGCFTTGSVFSITELNAFLSNPHIAVDQRTSGAGAGNVYAVVTQANPNKTIQTQISLFACQNADLNCSSSISISGTDLEANNAWAQVRPDGGITGVVSQYQVPRHQPGGN